MNRCAVPADTWAWLPLPDFLRVCEAVYGVSCDEMTPTDGEPFDSLQYGPYADSENFLAALLHHLAVTLETLHKQRFIHKSTAACAESAGATEAPAVDSGSCGPCG